jgi:hypothetical protein
MLANASLSCKRKRSMCLSLQLLRAALTQFPFLDITRPPPIGKLVVRSAERLILQRAAAERLLRMGLPRRLRHCGARQSVTAAHAVQCVAIMLQPQPSLAALHRAGWMRFAQAVRVHPSNALRDGDAAGAGMPRARFDFTHAHRRSCVRCRRLA